MDDKKNTWVTALVVMATGIFAYFHFAQQPMGERPQMKSPPEVSLIGEQNYPARLWEDPVAATERGDISPIGLNDLREQISRRSDDDKWQVQVLGIFIDGFAYPEDREARLRLRFAAQMAFACRNFKPADRNDLGSVSLPWPKGYELKDVRPHALEPTIELQPIHSENQQTVGYKRLLLNIPFEWFFSSKEKTVEKQEKTVKKAVLVLWLKEQDFADFPLTRLVRLRKALSKNYEFNIWIQPIFNWNQLFLTPVSRPLCFKWAGLMGLPAGCGTSGQNLIDFEIIGPRSLETLDRMDKNLELGDCEELMELIEFVGKSRDPVRLACSRFRFQPEELKDCFWAKGTSAVDGSTMTFAADKSGSNEIVKLIQELDWRGVKSHDQSVAVLYEGDTLYGRTCSQALCKMSSFAGVYLRGLDGVSARRIEEEAKSKNRESNSEESREEKPPSGAKGVPLEYSEGDRQFDYANRMAAALKERCKEKPLKAIGIFGSDAGDKLILLHALRKRFSDGTQFFTTELDARYLEPSTLPDTRNLIIASTYPLNPLEVLSDVEKAQDNPAGINKVPPFRDSTQTALFFACLRALGSSIALPETKTYVVGRKDFIELPDPTVLKAVTNTKWLGWILMFCTIATGLFLWERSFPIHISCRENPGVEEAIKTSRNRWAFATIILGLIVIVIITCFAISHTRQSDSEPFRMLDGVSIWPTELIRVATIFLIIVFMIFAWYKYRLIRFVLWSKYIKVDADVESPEVAEAEHMQFLMEIKKHDNNEWNKKKLSPDFFDRLRYFYKIRSIDYTAAGDDEGRLAVDKLLESYFRIGFLGHRCWRIAGLYLLFFLLVPGLTWIDTPPLSPARDGFSRGFDAGILSIGFMSFWFLTFYVFDVTRMALSMIRRLGASASRWPPKFLAGLSRKRNMNPEYLAGYADVKFVANYTMESSQIVVYPFIVLFMLLVARSQLFDRWPWPSSLKIVSVLVVVLIVWCSFSIRRAARTVREEAVKQLNLIKLERSASGGRNAPRDIAQIEQTLEEIKAEADGAYAPWFLDRAASAFLIPSAGALIIQLVEALFSAGSW